jgi:hypothetical protein
MSEVMAHHSQVVTSLSSARHRARPVLQRQLAVLFKELGRIPAHWVFFINFSPLDYKMTLDTLRTGFFAPTPCTGARTILGHLRGSATAKYQTYRQLNNTIIWLGEITELRCFNPDVR